MIRNLLKAGVSSNKNSFIFNKKSFPVDNSKLYLGEIGNMCEDIYTMDTPVVYVCVWVLWKKSRSSYVKLEPVVMVFLLSVCCW